MTGCSKGASIILLRSDEGLVLIRFFLNYMIEITTTIALLISSLYGTVETASVIDASVIDTTVATSTDNSAIVTVTTDRKSLEKYLRENYADTPMLLEIARCESTFTHYDKNGDVIRGRVNSADVGLMQINEKYHLETAEKLGLDIHTVEGNVNYAKYLYDNEGVQPWSASSPCWGKALPGSQDEVLAKN